MDRWLKGGHFNKKPVTEESLSTQSVEGRINDENSSQVVHHCNSNANGFINPIKKRKYNESYLEMGFLETNDCQPQCVICLKVLPNSSMYPGKLRRHFEKNHPDYEGKTTDYFKRKRTELLAVQNKIKTHVQTDNENALRASYMVSYRIAQKGEAHTIAGTLIKPCLIDIATCMLDEKFAKQLSYNTIARRIADLATNVEQTLVSIIKYRKFALQMDDSTDVAGLAILLVFVRYENIHSFEEDLLFCRPLLSNTTGVQIFGLLDGFFTENKIPWTNCIDVCTDGAKVMVGATAGAVAKIKEKSKEIRSSHCILHRHALAMKTMPFSLKNVTDDAIKIINFIKSRPLKSRLFKILCDDMGSLHSTLLFHTEVRWLSRDKALTRLMELRTEVLSFLMDHNVTLGEIMNDVTRLSQFSYLADIFSKMNELSLSLQGRIMTIFDASHKVSAFKRKIDYWAQCTTKGKFECFPIMQAFLEENDEQASTNIVNEIIEHLKQLKNSFEQYFPADREVLLEDHEWVLNPFSVCMKPSSLSSSDYERLIDLTSDLTLKSSFNSNSYAEFWLSLKDKSYEGLSEKAKTLFLPFATTSLCESGFSSYAATKTKYRNRLNVEPDLRLQLSKIKPDIAKLCQNKQPHTSH